MLPQGESKPLVSVIVPTRDRPQETARAVRSALLQSHGFLEIIVIDDGSADPEAMRQAILDLNDARVSLHFQGRNIGASSARNRGVRLSTGAYVAFLDSDDEWHSEKICRQLVTLTVEGPNAVIYCQARTRSIVGEEIVEQVIPSRAMMISEPIGDYLFCNRGAIVTPSLVMTRELALAVPFDESLMRHQDFAFLLRLEEHGCKFFMTPDELVFVDWRTLTVSGRHLRPQISRAFLESYGHLMSCRAKGGFWFRNVVMPYLFTGSRLHGIRLALVFPPTVWCLAMQPRELLKACTFVLLPKWVSHTLFRCNARLRRPRVGK
jgi:glycosyltransferase involved in cell wall biosynthesis